MKSPFITVAESEQAGTGLAVPLGDANEVFKPGGTALFIHAVRECVAHLGPFDISTPEGRQFVASTAYKIARTKTHAFAKGKELSAVHKLKAKQIDQEVDYMSAELDKLKHETRRPLTEWEDRDKERAGEFETRLGEIYNACFFVGSPTIEAIQSRMAKLRSYQGLEWAEYSARAEQGFAECFPALTAMLAKAEQEAADRAELEELRALKASRPFEVNAAAMAKPDGEAIPPRAITLIMRGDNSVSPPTPAEAIDCNIHDDLSEIVDYDQATDILVAIKAGKIRHVQIVY